MIESDDLLKQVFSFDDPCDIDFEGGHLCGERICAVIRFQFPILHLQYFIGYVEIVIIMRNGDNDLSLFFISGSRVL